MSNITTAITNTSSVDLPPTISLSGALPIDQIERRIRSFAILPVGWEFGKGRPSPNEIIEKALELYRMSRLLSTQIEVFPGQDGEITLAFYVGERTLEITINTDLSLDLVREIGIGINYDEVERLEGVNASDIYSRLIILTTQELTWKPSERLASSGIAGFGSDLQATVFATTGMESQYSTPFVLPEVPQLASVCI